MVSLVANAPSRFSNQTGSGASISAIIMRSFMRRLLLLAIATIGTIFGGDEAFNGRWVIEPAGENQGRVLWLEVNGAGTRTITGGMVGGGPGGQLNPIHGARIERDHLHFHLEWQANRSKRVTKTPVSVAIHDGKLVGVANQANGSLLWIGHRAPVISDKDDGSWKEGEPITLLDGTNLDHWQTLHPGREKEWYVEDGVMKNHEGADVLVTKGNFWNFRLQIEYRVRPKMNGGIGLRGRYEVQILDDHGQAASDHGNGSLYGRIKPSVNASRKADEWQTFDIRLVGRELTVILNSQKTIDRQIVEGFTAMASDWHEDQPGPITLQGDHGAVEFRRIVVTPLTQ